MRVVIDANVIISALLSRNGVPGKLLTLLVEEKHVFLISDKTMAELRRILNYPKIKKLLKLTDNEIEQLVSSIEILAEEVDTTLVPSGLECRDPDDVEYLAVATLGHAECIVSGDRDLLTLRTVEGIPVLTPVEMLERLTRS
jgi:putative PIN family toxin of toxin-antitoxin system